MPPATSCVPSLRACACGLLLGGGACAGAPPGGADRELAQALRARGVDPATVVVPWQLDGAMREWVHRHVPEGSGSRIG